ncbi:MAG TPA: hypothetical protein VK791_03635, partial [bacterium]|nr:hypothetical protein [bacterium]
ALSAGMVLPAGCHKSKTALKDLPLPPTVDGGLINGQFIQVDYGFGFPLPSKWIYQPVSAEQEVDEVARMFDPGREMIVRVSVQLRDPSEKFGGKIWSEQAEQDLKNHQFEIEKKESTEEWKTNGSDKWLVTSFRMTDTKNVEWFDEEWALAKDDYLIAVHATLPRKTAETDHGKKLFTALEDSLTRITWYMPIGSRGISSSRFELQHFTEEFCKALESKSLVQVGSYFDDMYPEKNKWNIWYQQAIAGDPKSFDLQAQLGGLIINGDSATASFVLIRKSKTEPKPQKFERNFKLAKKDGAWKIALSLDKD